MYNIQYMTIHHCQFQHFHLHYKEELPERLHHQLAGYSHQHFKNSW